MLVRQLRGRTVVSPGSRYLTGRTGCLLDQGTLGGGLGFACNCGHGLWSSFPPPLYRNPDCTSEIGPGVIRSHLPTTVTSLTLKLSRPVVGLLTRQVYNPLLLGLTLWIKTSWSDFRGLPLIIQEYCASG